MKKYLYILIILFLGGTTALRAQFSQMPPEFAVVADNNFNNLAGHPHFDFRRLLYFNTLPEIGQGNSFMVNYRVQLRKNLQNFTVLALIKENEYEIEFVYNNESLTLKRKVNRGQTLIHYPLFDKLFSFDSEEGLETFEVKVYFSARFMWICVVKLNPTSSNGWEAVEVRGSPVFWGVEQGKGSNEMVDFFNNSPYHGVAVNSLPGSSITTQENLKVSSYIYASLRGWLNDNYCEGAVTSRSTVINKVEDMGASSEAEIKINSIQDEYLNFDCHLYPDPILENSKCNLLFYSSTKKKVEIFINSVSGIVVFRKQLLVPAGGSEHSLDLNLSTGAYIISIITDEGEKLTKKLIVK